MSHSAIVVAFKANRLSRKSIAFELEISALT